MGNCFYNPYMPLLRHRMNYHLRVNFHCGSIICRKIFKLWFLRYKRKVIHRHLCKALAKKVQRLFKKCSTYKQRQQTLMSHLAHSICCIGWDFTLRVTLSNNVAASILHTGLLAKIYSIFSGSTIRIDILLNAILNLISG